MGERKLVEVKWAGREELTLDVEIDAHGVIQNGTVKGIGGPQFLKLIKEYRAQLVGKKLDSLDVPTGAERESICLREAVLKLKNVWNYPYKEEELCHCRAVPTQVVDQAICAGAHTPKKVSLWTSASTAC